MVHVLYMLYHLLMYGIMMVLNHKQICDSIAVVFCSYSGRNKNYHRDGDSNPGLPQTVEQVWASSDMTGGDTYHHTITDMWVG